MGKSKLGAKSVMARTRQGRKWHAQATTVVANSEEISGKQPIVVFLSDAMSDADFKKNQIPIIMAFAAQGKKARADIELLERKNKDVMLFCDNPECISVGLDKQVWICCCKDCEVILCYECRDWTCTVAFANL
jgi:hypothetical protein